MKTRKATSEEREIKSLLCFVKFLRDLNSPSGFILGDKLILFFLSDEEALKLIEMDTARSGGKKRGSNWQERDMGSILYTKDRKFAGGTKR